MSDRHPYLLAIAILFAGVLLAGAIYFTRSGGVSGPTGDLSLLRPVRPEDHLVGNPEAPVVIVEYSDIDCAYCKNFQQVLTQLMTEYAADGRVAWAYRHFPLINIHPYAAEHAEAAECVAEVGGEELFFPFIDAMQQLAPASAQFNPSGYSDIVSGLGVSVEAFTACRESDRNVERVTLDFENAVAAGGTGTPFTVILIQGAEPIPITGALPYDDMKEVITRALTQVSP
ncbi:DsbA family protein [Candidatus Parcubacteria bacterium]|nr:DsbA family protein [Candidatus Parcubacteria bacterium]